MFLLLYLLFTNSPPLIAITEFNVDPVDGRPAYVELHNPGSVPVNLKNWRMQRRQTSSETNRVISSNDLVLNAGAYVVMVADAVPMTDAYGPGPYHVMSRFPTFNRASPDEIRLFDAASKRIDSLQYNPTAWIRGTPHERKSVFVDAVHAENWAPGTSPGRPNIAQPPSEPLRILAIGIREPDSVMVNVSGRLLRFGGAVENHLDLHLFGIRDLFGNTLPDTTLRVRTNYPAPARSQLVINEMALWSASPFVELHNRTDEVMDVSGVLINGRPHARMSIAPGFHRPDVLQPGGYVVLTNLPTLSKTSSGLGLRHPRGVLLDSLRYGPTWMFGPESVSLERIDPARPTNDPKNWAAHPTSNSRGDRNWNWAEGAPFPHPDMADIHQGRIRLRFPRFVAWDESIRIHVDGVRAEAPSIDVMSADTWLLQEPSGEQLRIETIDGMVMEIPVSHPPEFGDLRINEVMFHPHQNRFSNRPDQSQYVELINITGRSLSLEGIHLADAPDKNGMMARMWPVSTDRRSIHAQALAVLYADTAGAWSTSRLATAFPLTPPEAALRLHRSTLSLTQAGKAILLLAGNGSVLDSVRYSLSWHHPARTQTEGISLEKIDPTLASHLAFNWTSTAAPAGGTPGLPNSVLRQPAPVSGSAAIAAEPNPFTELQAIHIRVDEPDYWVRIRIFDRYGRHIRTLAHNDPLGNGRYWWWNGLRDDGQSSPIGMYILLAELGGSSTAPDRTLRHILVLARSPF